MPVNACVYPAIANWWVESGDPLSAREVDDVFLALVVPELTLRVDRSGKR